MSKTCPLFWVVVAYVPIWRWRHAPTAIKRLRQAIEGGDKTVAQCVFQQSVAVLDRITDKKIVHKNKAPRTKSRLSAQIKALAAA